MKHRYLFLMLMLAVMGMGYAAEPTAQQVLANSAKRIANAKSITATFTSAAGDEDVSGTMTMSGKMFAMVAPDFGIWYDGHDLCSYFQATGEATLSVPTAEELMEVNPFDVINQYEKLFNVKMIEKKQRKYSVLLMSRNPESSIKSAMLTIDGNTWLPTQIIATLANDEIVNISITGVKVGDAPIAKTAFQFPAAKYPGVDLIDIR